MYEDKFDYVFDDNEGLTDFLSTQLVGHKIQTIEGSKITLDNGRVVEFEGYGDCCAWGDLDNLELLVSGDHIITSVEVTETNGSYSYATEFFVYGSGIPLASGDMSGDEGTGYYGFGVMITGKLVA